MVGVGGIEPPLPGPRPGALPLRDTPWSGELFRPGRLDSRRVMPVPVAGRVATPAAGAVPRLATWTASDSNREPSPCKGVALPVGASSPRPPGRYPAAGGRHGGLPQMLTL